MLVSSTGLIKRGSTITSFVSVFKALGGSMSFKRGHREPNLQVHWPEKQKKKCLIWQEKHKKNETYAKQAQTVRKVLCARVHPGTVKHSWSVK